MKIKTLILLITTLALVSGCAAAQVTLIPGAERVVLHKGDAPRNAVEVGPVEVTHGYGCGAFGAKGTYTGAYQVLRNKAWRLGANFVRIDVITRPFMNTRQGCFDNRFILLGVAFRVPPHTPAKGNP